MNKKMNVKSQKRLLTNLLEPLDLEVENLEVAGKTVYARIGEFQFFCKSPDKYTVRDYYRGVDIGTSDSSEGIGQILSEYNPIR